MIYVIINLLLFIIVVYQLCFKKNINNMHILKHTKSQFNQDLALYYNYFQMKNKGYFIEIGAFDGITISNSYFFEKNFNWHGILIEGGEKNCRKLKKNSKQRNNSIIICSPICKTNYTYYNDNGYYGSINRENNSYKKIKCNTLRNITQFFNVKHIDLFSLDVEGSELEVLETFDFNIPVSYWIIEWNNLNRIKRQKINKMLNDNGYFIDKIYISPIDRVFRTNSSKYK